MTSRDQSVRLGKRVYIAPTAYVGGDVVIGDACTVMYHAVIRGDLSPIRIGRRVNVQDGAILHTDRGVPLEIGDEVAIAHHAVVHGRSVGSLSLIGIGALVLAGCEIGERCIIAPGAVVPPNTKAPPGSVLMGVPARIVRATNDEDLARIRYVAESYVELGRRHAAGEFPPVAPEK